MTSAEAYFRPNIYRVQLVYVKNACGIGNSRCDVSLVVKPKICQIYQILKIKVLSHIFHYFE